MIDNMSDEKKFKKKKTKANENSREEQLNERNDIPPRHTRKKLCLEERKIWNVMKESIGYWCLVGKLVREDAKTEVWVQQGFF